MNARKLRSVLGKVIFTVGFGMMIPLFILLGLIELVVEGIGKLMDICISLLERGNT